MTVDTSVGTSNASSESGFSVASPLRTPTTMSTKAEIISQEVFLKAVRAGDSSELERLLQRWEGSLNVNFYDHEGQTALHKSVMEGNLELVKLLVKFGADVRLANRDGWSALHIAAYGGHKDIVVYLGAKLGRR